MHERELAYLKSLITPSYAVQFSPSGMYCPYEAGYVLLALVEKGEYSLARECLDELATIQYTEPWNGYTVGAWYQQYYPYTVGLVLRGAYPIWEVEGVIQYLIVDSGIAFPIIAMARYDQRMGTTRYLTPVRRGLGFLKRVFQDPVDMKIRDLRYQNVIENMAFCADMAEVLLAIRYALDAYGAITDSTEYPITTFGGEVASFIHTNFWKPAGKYWQTEYPLGAESFGLKAFKQRITFVQALTAWAMYRWDSTAYGDTCRFALDLVNATMMGNDGGYYEFPTFTDEDVKRGGLYRYPLYTAFMVIAMKTVDAARYRNWINRGLSFIRMMTTQRGEVYNYIDDRDVKGIWVPMATYYEGVVVKPLIPTGFVGYHTACKILAEIF